MTGTKDRSLFYQIEYRKYPKYSLQLTLGPTSPKQKCLGLTLAFVNGQGCFCFGKTMTYVLYLPQKMANRPSPNTNFEDTRLGAL